VIMNTDDHILWRSAMIGRDHEHARRWSWLNKRWSVSEACRLVDDVAHPTHSTSLRSGSVCRSC